MKKNVVYIMIILFVNFSSCTESSNKKNTESESSGIEIEIDEKSTPEIIPLSKLLRPPKVIVLEDNEECLLGNIEEMQVFDSLIFMLDIHYANALFIFNTDGKFIRRIGRRGQGPGEYSIIFDFTIDTKREELYILTAEQRIHKYRIDGTFVETITIPSFNRTLFRIQYYENHIYADVIGDHLAEDNEMLIKIDATNGKITGRYFKMTEYNYGWNLLYSEGGPSFKARLNNPPFYVQTFMNQIISLDDMQPYIFIENDNSATTKDMDKLKQDVRAGVQMALFNFPQMHSIRNFIKGDSFIFFNYDSSGRLRGVLYDKKHNTTTFGMIKNDLVYKNIYYMPSFHCQDNKGVYSMITPGEIGVFLGYISENEIVEDLDKFEQLRNLPEDSNGFIFYYEFKDAE